MVIWYSVQIRGGHILHANEQAFWESKKLEDLNRHEWEALCDKCGRCCLLKLEDEVTGEIYLTKLVCSLLDQENCQCRGYAKRHKKMADCVQIDPEKVRSLSWLPETCGYRRIAEGRGLAWWHPLISGTTETVHAAGISVRGWTHSEDSVSSTDYYRYIIEDLDAD